MVKKKKKLMREKRKAQVGSSRTGLYYLATLVNLSIYLLFMFFFIFSNNSNIKSQRADSKTVWPEI